MSVDVGQAFQPVLTPVRKRQTGMSVLQGEVMGRVYDALRRGAAEPNGPTLRQPYDSSSRGDFRNHRIVPSAKQIEEQLFTVSSILARAEDAVKSSAFTAHTPNASDGTALPGGTASRAVGATLDAARPPRA